LVRRARGDVFDFLDFWPLCELALFEACLVVLEDDAEWVLVPAGFEPVFLLAAAGFEAVFLLFA
jgi:hypothetical protein